MRSLGVDVVEYNIDKDKDRRDEMRRRSGSTGVPVIDVDGRILRGFSPEAIRAALDQSAR
jgi:glutaredoxin 3